MANTQLLVLLQRAKKFVTGNWSIEKPHAEWEPPWAPFPAKFIVSQRTKEDEVEVHLQLLANI